ncbi:MAG: hypothetical protein BMS9Abin14_151 [Gammaproteobacteria bacterium]|nr:MAG: hypothetical protein BMS9Abin14_151 [Gammaproteobacteria bacterium]
MDTRYRSQDLSASKSVDALFSVLLVIPTLNEAEGLAQVLADARALGVETLIVDGGSTDGTKEIARELGGQILEVSAGKGHGWRDFLAKFPYRDWEFIAMVDGDGSYDLMSLPELLEHNVDMAIGLRRSTGYSGTWFRAMGAQALSLLAGWSTLSYCPDLLSGFRLIRSECLDRINLTSDGFGLEAEFTIEFLRRGFSIEWVPVHYQRRLGRSKLSPIKDGWIILWTILRTAIRPL